ncbi:hypothetical protein TNCT_300451, partial [Trichonephila clavata]
MELLHSGEHEIAVDEFVEADNDRPVTILSRRHSMFRHCRGKDVRSVS